MNLIFFLQIIALIHLVKCNSEQQIYQRDYVITNKIDENEKTTKYWIDVGQSILLKNLERNQLNTNIAKNVIFFLGDGMSVPTVAASRIYKGQLNGYAGEESELSFERFPYTGLSKTYCIDKQVADSACSATAYLAGIKAPYSTLGVNGNVTLNNCDESMDPNNHVTSIATWFQRAGKPTGIVTTTQLTDATPAGVYSHAAHRDYECDTDILIKNQNPQKCQDIASQLILNEPGRNFNVILGGGRQKFLPNNIKDENGLYGQRSDGKDLIKIWLKHKQIDGWSREYVYDKQTLENVNLTNTEYLLGIFNTDHLDYKLDADNDKQPTLAEMTKVAINMLQERSNGTGYFLFIEGGRIDQAHHDLYTRKALEETVQFSDAIDVATKITNEEDTLIIVTADHSHTMSFVGYPERGTDILGLNTELSNIDLIPYTILSYTNGINGGNQYKSGKERSAPTVEELKNKDYQFPSMFPMDYEGHGGDDVAVYAKGPWAHLFTGTYEQNAIPHMLAYAACVGDGLTVCK